MHTVKCGVYLGFWPTLRIPVHSFNPRLGKVTSLYVPLGGI